MDIHNIISFDVKKLAQATKHTYGDDEELNFAVRAKVPVRDGRSQNVSSIILFYNVLYRNSCKRQKR